jgi:tRNA (pseudouridine54-N1)-methyltransferase
MLLDFSLLRNDASMNQNKRIFILLLKKAKPNPSLNINNLSGEGRIDILCRVLTNTFFLGGGDMNFRKNSELWVYFQSYGKKLMFKGNDLRGMNPDERSQAGILKKVFSGQNLKGIEYSSASWSEVQKTFPNCVILDVLGVNLNEIENNQTVFLLGDHIGLTEEEKSSFKKENKVSLGNHVYLSSQCVSILNYKLDQNH